MKTLKLFFIIPTIFLFLTSTNGQSWWGNYYLNFDNGQNLHHLKIDNISNPNNIWQIGVPQKSHFNVAHSIPNVIVTQKTNPYPINDTSVFIIKNTANGGFTAPHTVIIRGYYSVYSDTLTDFGKFEFSPNNGSTWVDLINSGTYSPYIMWYSPKPTLSGNSNGWKRFEVNIAQLGPLFNIHFNDTVLYRFTFISDNIQTNKDGLMFDSFEFIYFFEGINETNKNNIFSISPCPALDIITIYQKIFISYTTPELSIYNLQGQLLIQQNLTKTETEIDISGLQPGVYFATLLLNGAVVASEKLIIE